jgi:prepilin-type N-terminal cleavage/methylation domain-containing protein
MAGADADIQSVRAAASTISYGNFAQVRGMGSRRFLPGNTGFTLLELIVSVGILVLLLSAAVPMWQIGLKLWQQQSSVLEMQQDQRIVLECMARELRRARRTDVEIVSSGGIPGYLLLQFKLDEQDGHGIRTIQYTQRTAQTSLSKITNRGEGAGTNTLLTGLKPEDGFVFAFVDPVSGTRRTRPGSRLQDSEVVELILRCQRGDKEFEVRTQIAPRN